MIKTISQLLGINSIYISLIIKTIIVLILFKIIKKIGLKILLKLKDSKKEYQYGQKYKLMVNILSYLVLLFIWTDYLKTIMTLISFISAGFAIAIRDIIFNFFSGIYIKINKPFNIEDRIEINNYKGDVININALNFEVLEVNNETFTGQSTGVITHIPNSIIFSYPLRNYNKAFKYIWNEIKIKIPINSDIAKTKSTIYKIVNNIDAIKNIPTKTKNEILSIQTEYRIYFNHYEPIIYTKIIDNYIELSLRYLVHPKKARYIESTISNKIIEANNKKELELYTQE